MSMSISKVLSRGHQLLRNEIIGKNFINATRTLIDPAALDIDQYVKNREITKKHHSDLEEVFRKRAKEDLKSEFMISSDSLRTMMYLVENNAEDLDLLTNMIKKYHGNNQWKLGTLVNGTVAMRAFHFLNQPKLALEIFKDPSLETFFDQLSSYEILLDLLFKNKFYKEVIDTFDAIKDRLKKPLTPSIIVFGACYKLNTPESFEYAMNLHTELEKNKIPIFNKNLTFLSALALTQGKPDVALELIALHTSPRSIIYRNMTILANANLERWTNVQLALSEALTDVTPTFKRKLFKEVLDGVEAKLSDQHKNIGDMVRELREGGFLHELSLDEYLCTKINIGFKTGERASNENSNQHRFRRQNFNRSNTTSQNREKTAQNLKKFADIV